MSGNAIIEDQRKYISITEQGAENVKSTDFPGTYYGYDDTWNTKKFIKNTRLDIFHISETEMKFDLVGIDVSLANALRRVVMSEAPSMAIDRLDIANNTSLIHDEHLAHMIGLVPIKADPRYFQFRPEVEYASAEDYPISAEYCIGFKLAVKCGKKGKKGDVCVHSSVYSGDLKWFSIGGQTYADPKNIPSPVHDDILIAKLAPGQEINLRCYCYKDVGKTHAKFMPTCLFNFMEMPEIVLLRRVVGEQAVRLKALFTEGVVEVVKNEDGEDEAVIVSSREDLISRNVFLDEALKDAVSIKLNRNHFMFEVESLGNQDIKNLLLDCLNLLTTRFQQEISLSTNPHIQEEEVVKVPSGEKHKFKPKKKNK